MGGGLKWRARIVVPKRKGFTPLFAELVARLNQWLKAMHDAAEAKEALCRIALEMRAEGISRWDRFSIACDAYRDAEALRVKEALADRAQARRELVVKLFNRGV